MQPFDRIEDPAKLRRLVQAILILDAELNLPVVLRRISHEARDLVDAQYGALGVLTEDGQALDQFLTVVTSAGGTVDKVDVWGRRRLAYEIDKKSEGIYTVIELKAEPDTVKELDRQLNLNEAVLRTKIVRPDK